jgi:hypothetical protein
MWTGAIFTLVYVSAFMWLALDGAIARMLAH